MDGLIVLPLDPDAPRWRRIARATPTVSVNASLPAPARSVRFASDAGIALALDHLQGLGHGRIAVLGASPHRLPRRRGVRRVRCGLAVGEARSVALRVLGRPDRPTAVFALSDSVAYGVYEACRDLRLRVPRDLSVVGFDDHPISRLLAPPLTAVGWDTPAAATGAAAALEQAIAGLPATGAVVLMPQLTVRRSTCPPAAGPAG